MIEASLTTVRRERLQILVSEDVLGSRDLESLLLGPLGPARSVALVKSVVVFAVAILAVTLVFTGSNEAWWLVVGAAVGVIIALGILHLVARTFSHRYGERIGLRSASGVRRLNRVLRPLLALDERTVRNPAEASEEEDVTPDQPPSTEPDGEPLDEREAQMIRGVVRLDQTVAREIMVPRVDIVSAEMGAPLHDMAKQMTELGHSRLPVYEGSPDDVVGVVYARDILINASRDSDVPKHLTPDLVRPALFIPESKTLGELLDEFQARQVHIAIVIDEYGGVSGLVTIEDLLEEIVGEIRDEFDVVEEDIEEVRSGEFVMDAKISLDQVNDLLGAHIEGDGFDTVGGLVYKQLGKIPGRGDTVQHNGVTIEVLSTVGRRLKRLRLSTKKEQATSP